MGGLYAEPESQTYGNNSQNINEIGAHQKLTCRPLIGFD
jgi:hypothetical protein